MWEDKNSRRMHFCISMPFQLLLLTLFCLMQTGLSVTASQNSASQRPAAGTSHASDSVRQGLVFTRLSSQGRTVTLTVNITKDSQVSSGRIKIHYPSEFLRVTDAQGGKLWSMEDVNTGLSESGQSLVSYAWVGKDKYTGEGNLLTVTWEALEAANRREIAVETEISEIYSLEDRLTVNPDWIIDRLRPDFPSGNPVRTGDESNAAGLALLCLGTVLVMARLIRVKAG